MLEPYELRTTHGKEVKRFSVDAVEDWARRCMDAGGDPRFRVRFKGKLGIYFHGSPATIAYCYGDEGNRVDSVIFYGVPEDLWTELYVSHDDLEVIRRWKGGGGGGRP